MFQVYRSASCLPFFLDLLHSFIAGSAGPFRQSQSWLGQSVMSPGNTRKLASSFFHLPLLFPAGLLGNESVNGGQKKQHLKGAQNYLAQRRLTPRGLVHFLPRLHTHTHLYVYFQVVYSGPETGQPAKKLGNDSFVCPQTQIIRSNRPRATNSFGRGGKKQQMCCIGFRICRLFCCWSPAGYF